MVRLGLIVDCPECHGWAPFNPTVVRLGRPLGQLLDVRPHRLSIPLWCDWDAARESWAAATTHLSIPLWCDWDQALEDGKPEEALLSIPLWCDWDGGERHDHSSQVNLSIPLWCDWDQLQASPRDG